MPSKRKGKKTPASKRSKKPVEAKPKKGKVGKPKKSAKPKSKAGMTAEKKKRHGSRFNAVQKLLAAYARDNGIKLGRNFQRSASLLYNKTKDVPLKYIEQNIDQLYKNYLKQEEVPKLFPDRFEFYMFSNVLQGVKFDKATVAYTFDDGLEQFEAEGNRDEVFAQFKESGFYRHLRQYYNGSPPNNAQFVIAETDNKTFVKYKVETFTAPTRGAEAPETPPEAPKTAPEGSAFTAQEIIAIEREKQKTAQLQIKKLKEVQKLMKLGYTKDEINKLLGE